MTTKVSKDHRVMDELLKLYDWHIRFADLHATDYRFGYADAIGQCIIDVGKALGENGEKPYKFEAYKRVMQYDTTENYWKKYPKPLADYFPTDVIKLRGAPQ